MSFLLESFLKNRTASRYTDDVALRRAKAAEISSIRREKTLFRCVKRLSFFGLRGII